MCFAGDIRLSIASECLVDYNTRGGFRFVFMNLRHALTILVLVLGISTPCIASSLHQDEGLDAAILQANQLFLDAKFDEGINLLKEAQKTRGSSPAVSFFIANGYWWKIFRVYVYDKNATSTPFDKDFDYYLQETIDRSENLLEKNDRDTLALFYLGNTYSLKSRVKGLRGSYFSASRDAAKGKRYLEDALKTNQNLPDASYNLGVYNYLAGTLPGYAKVLKFFLFLPGGSKQKGLDLLNEAAKKSTYFGDEAQLLLARFYADFEDRPADALKIVQSFHTRYPDNAWFHYWSGTLLSDELNDYEHAEATYQEILTRCDAGEPSYTAEVRNQSALKLARVHTRLLQPELAIEEINTLIASKPKDPQWILAKAYLDLGNTYDQVGMRSEAIASYRHVLSLKDYRDFHDQAQKLISQNYNQKLADIYRMNLEGRRLATKGDFEQAEESLKKVMAKYPANEQTMFAMAEVYYLKGSYKDAITLLNQIIAKHPKEPKWLLPGVYVKLGQVYQASKQAEAAKRSYEKALETEFIASDDRNLAKRALRRIGES